MRFVVKAMYQGGPVEVVWEDGRLGGDERVVAAVHRRVASGGLVPLSLPGHGECEARLDDPLSAAAVIQDVVDAVDGVDGDVPVPPADESAS